jgi:nitroreductase
MLLNEILSRRSGYAFSDKEIGPEKVQALFEAAHWAPSSRNIQPWRYIYAMRSDPEFQLLLNLLFEGNQRWAKNAGLLILSLAQTKYRYQDNIIENRYSWHDTGLANSLLIIQAVSMGLLPHPMGGFDAKRARKDLDIPTDYDPVAMIAVGYHGDDSILPDDLLSRLKAPRSRKFLNEIVFRVNSVNLDI